MVDQLRYKTLISTLLFTEYRALLRNNYNYKLYVLSHCCQHAGDWFVRVAALITANRISGGKASALGMLVIFRTIPEIIFSQFGGLISDRYDRRKTMIRLDISAALVVFSYIYSVRVNSLRALYFATALRSTVSALYLPITQAIVPQLVLSGKEDLKRAATLNGSIWSSMLVLGGAIAGWFSAKFGVEMCYIVDICTYLLSAIVMSRVKGDFNVHETKTEDREDGDRDKKANLVKKVLGMIRELFLFLRSCGFATLIFLKATGCLIWGSADVLNVAFAHVENDEAESSRRMGLIFSSVGVGCVLGPAIANCTIVDGKKPSSLQFAIVIGLLFMTAGWAGVAFNSHSFWKICLFTSVRTIGSAMVWLFSTLILQNLVDPKVLGRVFGLEFSLARITETIIATTTGTLRDAGRTKQELALMSTAIAAASFLFWSTYHFRGNGAAMPRFNTGEEMNENREKNLLNEYEHEAIDVLT